MATVEEIARRIVAEASPPPQPWATREQRAVVQKKTWAPNRKVVTGLVTGAISWAAFKYLGVDLDPEVENGLTVLAMGLVSYLVPLSED